MWIEVDASEIHDPRELRFVANDDLFRRSPGRELELNGFDPVGARRRRSLLEEEVTFYAVHIPFHRHGARGNAADRAVSDGEVVLGQINLRVARAREEDLVGIRDRDLMSGELENNLFRGHLFTICTRADWIGAAAGRLCLKDR